MTKQLQEKLDHLTELTKQKDIPSIQAYLTSADTQLKGSLFEFFLKLLFEGNGWLTQHVGRSGESSADILLFHPSTPTNVQLIVQAKNHNRPLTWDETITELTKFEKLGTKKYNCNNFWILSVSGFVSEAKKLCEFNLDLKSWNYVEELIRDYNPEEIKQPKLTLYPHNEEAYKSIVETWKTKKKVAIVQATGTGKSFLIAKILADDLQKKKLVIAPQSYILQQQKNRIPWANTNVVYRTYHKLIWCSNEELQELQPDIIFLDEFHRCGADEWGSAITRLLKMYPDAYILGTSATPIRYLDQSRDMAEELFDGNVPVRISIADAIKRKILPAPKYISSLYQIDTEGDRLIEQVKGSNRTDSEKQKLLQKVENVKIEWKQSAGVPVVLNKHLPHDVTKMIVFCEDNAHLNQMRSMFIQWFAEAGIQKNINQYVVTRQNSARDEELERFKSSKPKKDQLHVLFSINMLNEGIHVEDVAAVFLMRKTVSPRLFYQQIGRCIQTNAQQTPIIFDLVNNFKNIRAIDFKKDLDEAERRLNDRRFTFGLSMIKVPVSIIDETRDVVQMFEDIERSLESWEVMFEELVKFIKENGHSFANYSNHESQSFANWVHRQRTNKRKGILQLEYELKLDAINFSWDPGEEKWFLMFEKLRQYFGM
ncbi:MAG: DEAD/DEAH box helicase family protein, partial [Bacteroidota bacterium]|nr:DEAD/DEAH box helicase family protein [Bacteroidota bacterium]